MNNSKFIIIIIIFTLIIIIGGIILVSNSTAPNQITYSKNTKAFTLDPTSFDWGNIPYKGGDVVKTFRIQNKGTDILKIYNVKTSCHCTVANVTIDGKASQNFGMSGISSWVGEISTGKEALLTVIFDPAYHGLQGLGPITRFVSIETNEQGNNKITFTLTGKVINEK